MLTVGAGALEAPVGMSPTGEVYNPEKWSVLQGDTITDSITGATDAVSDSGDADSGPIEVAIQSSTHGNTFVTGTLAGDTITFSWTAVSPDGSDICSTTIVSYRTSIDPDPPALGENVATNNNAIDIARFGEAKKGEARRDTVLCAPTARQFSMEMLIAATPSPSRP
jgi:hypothetical protein